MMNISSIFLNNSEDYVTIPAIRKFIDENPDVKIKHLERKEDLLSEIMAFGDKSESNSNRVLDWLDSVCSEGIKDIYLSCRYVKNTTGMHINDRNKANSFLDQYINQDTIPHICSNTYGKKFKLINAYAEETCFGDRLVFVYCKRLTTYDKKQRHRKDIDFPVIAEYYVKNSWLLVKVKPRSNIYEYDGINFNIENAIPTNVEKQVREVQDLVSNILDFESDSYTQEESLKNKLFEILKLYTNTPVEIEDILEQQKHMISSISSNIKKLCQLPDSQMDDVYDDIRNIVEKYLSITWPDKTIFTKDREAYPIKLNATDDEASRVEQVAGFAQPLQTKAVFFDNKKMLYKSQKCDNIELKWKRLNSKYFRDSFNVNISVTGKGVCILKFREYVVQEDIENVLSKIIGV